MIVKPGTLMPLPEGFPEHGTLRGERVALADVEALLPYADWAEVVADVGGAEVRPWKGVALLAYADDGTPLGPAL